MGDLTLGRIKLAATLLKQRTFDDDPMDEVYRQAAIYLGHDERRIRELQAEVAAERAIVEALKKGHMERVDELAKDSKRLDWLMDQFANWWPGREDIDREMLEKEKDDE